MPSIWRHSDWKQRDINDNREELGTTYIDERIGIEELEYPNFYVSFNPTMLADAAIS